MPSPQQAAEAHIAVPDKVRYSELPITESLSPNEIPHRLGRDSPSRPDAEIISTTQSIAYTGFTSISLINTEVLNTVARYPRSVELSDLGDDRSLKKAMRDGVSFAFLPPVSDNQVVPPEVAKRAEGKGILSRSAPRRTEKQQLAVNRAHDSAVYVARRRVSNILHYRSGFLVRGPSRGTFQTPYRLEQFWLVKSTLCPDSLRLIAIELSFDASDVSPDAVARREVLVSTGIEVQCAIGWWALIDPLRFVVAILLHAGMTVPDYLRARGPGSRIADYKCAQCTQLMIRDVEGRGIVEHDGCYVHEHCFDRFVNTR